MRDPGLEALIDLNGEVIVLESGLWAKFVVHLIPADDRRSRGISYSLTLHDPSGSRVFGIDNAHSVRVARGPSGKRTTVVDHIHRGNAPGLYQWDWQRLGDLSRRYRTAGD